MNPTLLAVLLSIQLLAPMAPTAFTGPTRTTPPFDGQALRAHCDQTLEGLRAGRTQAPTLLEPGERAVLQHAHLAGADLAGLRAAGLSNEQWTWVAVGALVVIVLILI
jgi:hypothetical protein